MAIHGGVGTFSGKRYRFEAYPLANQAAFVLLFSMEAELRYRGLTVSADGIEFINRLVEENPEDSRRLLSKKLCEIWDWRQANGYLRDTICRVFLLQLERAGHIKLPPKKCTPPNNFAIRRECPVVKIEENLVVGRLADIQPLEFRQVRFTPMEKVFNSLISQYHYLGYCHCVGEQLKYMIYHGDRPIACMSWSSAARHIGSRDTFIGWNKPIRERNLHLMAYNSRFLILPWVKVPHLASHILGKMAQILQNDWEVQYKHPIYYLETFVDKERFKGTCYYAANWKYLGDTTGRGKNDQTMKPNRSIKAVLGYPLTKRFREYLCR
jgi:hypothetical protein